jgi:hypothetical protein
MAYIENQNRLIYFLSQMIECDGIPRVSVVVTLHEVSYALDPSN